MENDSVFIDISDDTFRGMLIRAVKDKCNILDKDIFQYKAGLESRDFRSVVTGGVALLKKCKCLLDDDDFKKLIKGTPFYWIGTAAFLCEDYEMAVYYYDLAVSEDIRSSGGKAIDTDTPAMRFILLNEHKHAAGSLVKKAVEKIDISLKCYNESLKNNNNLKCLNICDIREHFLKKLVKESDIEYRSITTAFISYFLEWTHRSEIIELFGIPGSAEPFFMHLLKGCLLFESLLRANETKKICKKSILSDALKYVSDNLKIGTPIKIGNTTLEKILSELPSQSFETAILNTGKIRNTLAHNLVWKTNKFDSDAYNRLASDIAVACLHVISCLYPDQPKVIGQPLHV